MSSSPALPKLQTSLSYISYVWSHVRAEVFWKIWEKLDEAFLDLYRNWSILLNGFFFFFTQVFWHVMTQKHMGWKIPDLPKSWVFSTQSRFSGSSWGPESKINKRNSPFWLVVFLPSLMELWCVPRDSLPHNYPSTLNSRNRGLGKDLAKLSQVHAYSVSDFFMVTEWWFLNDLSVGGFSTWILSQ